MFHVCGLRVFAPAGVSGRPVNEFDSHCIKFAYKIETTHSDSYNYYFDPARRLPSTNLIGYRPAPRVARVYAGLCGFKFEISDCHTLVRGRRGLSGAHESVSDRLADLIMYTCLTTYLCHHRLCPCRPCRPCHHPCPCRRPCPCPCPYPCRPCPCRPCRPWHPCPLRRAAAWAAAAWPRARGTSSSNTPTWGSR